MIRTTTDAPLLIFVHLPKTAGTTLTRILQRQYGCTAVLELYDSTCGEELRTLPGSQISRIQAVIGHFQFGAHVFVSRPSTYITLLRDPVERVISHYYFVRRQPDHYLYAAAQAMDVREFVTALDSAEPNNDQTRLLAGTMLASHPDADWGRMLNAAKANLRNHFTVVGLVEEFDRSLILMQRALGWRLPLYSRENTGRNRPPHQPISEHTLQTIRDYNQADIALYEYARSIFCDDIRSYGRSLDRELALFRSLNRVRSQARIALRRFWRMPARRQMSRDRPQ
jgi:Sulfotransferase family